MWWQESIGLLQYTSFVTKESLTAAHPPTTHKYHIIATCPYVVGSAHVFGIAIFLISTCTQPQFRDSTVDIYDCVYFDNTAF